MEIEYGSSQPLRFAQGALRDSEGKEILCKCGKPAGNCLIGEEAFMAFCANCSQQNISNGYTLVYKEPSERDF